MRRIRTLEENKKSDNVQETKWTEERITIEEFVELAGVKERTIRKNKDKIPGLSYNNGNYDILKGTRYPFNLRSAKLKDYGDRKYYLLKAIDQYQYIDYKKLRLNPEQFEDMLNDLLIAGLVKKNRVGNYYGANGYDITDKGESVLNGDRIKAIKTIVDLTGSGLGCAARSFLSDC